MANITKVVCDGCGVGETTLKGAVNGTFKLELVMWVAEDEPTFKRELDVHQKRACIRRAIRLHVLEAEELKD